VEAPLVALLCCCINARLHSRPLADARSEEGSEGPGGLEALAAAGEDLIQGEGVRNARLLVWLGDFNYRIDDYSYLEVRELITRQAWPALLEKVGGWMGGRAWCGRLWGSV
jgi:hypothetical protein